MNQISHELAISLGDRSEPVPGRMSDFLVLTKARLTSLVLITTFVGFCLGSDSVLDWVQLAKTLLGTALVAASAQVFNQVLEKDIDRLMKRTRNRPLPAGRMTRAQATAIGVAMGMSGILILAGMVNLNTAMLAGCTLLVYLGAYTPLKQKTALCIPIGAVAGAIPPVIGWVAVQPHLGGGAWILFAVLFTWQMPHFLSIAWMYREDYAEAGFVMLRPKDGAGLWTAWESLVYTVGLTVATALPAIVGRVHWVYWIGVVGLNAGMLFYASQFLAERTRSRARKLFFASILYLPLILGLLVLSRL